MFLFAHLLFAFLPQIN